ncbi:hypothetical protein FGG08_003991 [Glutinoglossum americanum]|uniref:N-acetylgalactosaminide beta-1,3-galactosyltransferase n=1 Tax=Glutinoglossum americanum TaxID=1670608 RepID=A0A9P8IA01_9PEZI|nr:hypothetical protein FGG08_003991 [Glutinoglossum americanum]
MSFPSRQIILPKLTVRVILYICTAAALLSGLTAYWSLQGPLKYTIEHELPSSNPSFQRPTQQQSKIYPSTTLSAPSSKATTPFSHLLPEDLEGSEDVELIFKTGATELFDKLPVHFVTTLTHVPHYNIFSDIDQKVGDYVIHDSLKGYNRTVKEKNSDFKLYLELQNDKPLRQDPKRLGLKGGWELDKYKNIYTLSEAFKMRPDAKWYLFIDADTYVMWPNLLRWLKDKDHKKPLYFGSPAMFKDVTFGHGGTGYLVSNGAMQEVVGKNPDVAKNYEDEAANSCCGDHVIGKLFFDHGIELTRANPSFNGEPPYSVAFAMDRWCEPVVTFHHMLASDVEDMWEFERENATANRDIIFADIFAHFVEPQLIEERECWDNYSENERWENVDGRSNLTYADCKKACEDDEDCRQFMFKKGSCKTSPYVKAGWKLPAGDTMKSGWLLDRTKALREKACPR